MPTDGGTIANRITDLIGSEYTNAAYYGDLINAAINEIADMISEDLLIKYSKTPGILESNSEWLVEDRKVLKVTRVDANSSGRECLPVDRDVFSRAGDSASIFKATAYSPIYHLDSANDGAATLKILPEPNNGGQTGRIWYFSYVADSDDKQDITGALLNSSLYLPSNLIHAIALKSSINILSAYISNQVQDEEDMELLGMVNQQKQSLEGQFQSEIQRFMDESGKPGSE